MPNGHYAIFMKNHPNTPRTGLEVFALLIGLLLCFHYLQIRIDWKKALEKRVLHRIYGIDPKTFGKWVVLFCPDLIAPECYARCRKLPPHLALAILLRLGLPCTETPVLGKRQIIESAEGSYRTLRESIWRFPDRFGIDPAVFKTLHVFPPEIARQMRSQYS